MKHYLKLKVIIDSTPKESAIVCEVLSFSLNTNIPAIKHATLLVSTPSAEDVFLCSEDSEEYDENRLTEEEIKDPAFILKLRNIIA